MFTDISIDLETLGVRPGSVITQIGLCAFNLRPESSGQCATSATNILVDPQTMIDAGFYVDWSTISWWLKQDEAPRVHMADQKGHPITRALMHVGDFMMESVGYGKSSKDLRVWGHGCGFDCTQLEVAFQKMGLPVPWDFRKVRDLRTLVDLTPAMRVERPVPTEAHNAMADATAQAEWIRKLVWQIEKREVGVIVEQPHQ